MDRGRGDDDKAPKNFFYSLQQSARQQICEENKETLNGYFKKNLWQPTIHTHTLLPWWRKKQPGQEQDKRVKDVRLQESPPPSEQTCSLTCAGV